LYKIYAQAKQIEEFESVVKMFRKHETEIVNFFRHGFTNAKAENLNGKLLRFVTGYYGIKDKNLFLYGVAGYFS
jgi:transposase